MYFEQEYIYIFRKYHNQHNIIKYSAKLEKLIISFYKMNLFKLEFPLPIREINAFSSILIIFYNEVC